MHCAVRKPSSIPSSCSETVAPYLASQLFGLWQGADVIHFGDNNAANAAAIKGNTAVEPSRDDISSLIDMGAQETKFVFPDLLTSLR